jgi:hypothetical protein
MTMSLTCSAQAIMTQEIGWSSSCLPKTEQWSGVHLEFVRVFLPADMPPHLPGRDADGSRMVDLILWVLVPSLRASVDAFHLSTPGARRLNRMTSRPQRQLLDAAILLNLENVEALHRYLQANRKLLP